MAATLDDIAALLTEQNALLRRFLDASVTAPPATAQPMGSISRVIPPDLCGDELLAVLRARKAEQRAARKKRMAA